MEAVADLVEHIRRDGRRQYLPEAKQAVLEQCARPGVSIAAVALATESMRTLCGVGWLSNAAKAVR